MSLVMLNYLLYLTLLYTVIEIFYVRIAEAKNIIDRPNHRSSHKSLTIRGGGIIFPIAFLVGIILAPVDGWIYYAVGLLAIASISFLDDINNVDSKVRFFIHILAVLLLLWQGQSLDKMIAVLFFVTFIGFINVYNFLDGINGITALYSIVTIGTFFWISLFITPLLHNIVFVSLLSALMVFSFFNLRKTAKCFSGDVGSISIAYIICILLLASYQATGSMVWFALAGIYAIDGGFTILCRLLRKEDIFKAHRSHFYQYLANERKWNHIAVSILYSSMQLIVNILVIFCYQNGLKSMILILLLVLFIIYFIFRLCLEGFKRLFNSY